MRVEERIEEQNRIIEMLTQQMDKNNAKIGIVKKHYEKKITELNREIEALKQKLEEREREFRAQGLKLKDLMSDEFRQKTIKKNYEELEHLTLSPPQQSSQKRLDIDQITIAKLDIRKSLLNKYGRLPLKPGFNKKKINFKDKLNLIV